MSSSPHHRIQVNPNLTLQDRLVLKGLLDDINARETKEKLKEVGQSENEHVGNGSVVTQVLPKDQDLITHLRSLNNPNHHSFQPTIFQTFDISPHSLSTNPILRTYTRIATKIIRDPKDIVIFTHLLLYFSTSLPSTIYLYKNFTYLHGIIHTLMQIWYAGAYTLLKHQHIHMSGVLMKSFPWNIIDQTFPYIFDPLHGHTWNSYYYHHVKHHHIESNGPNDLSSTIRYQRDSISHFLQYWARFFFLIWIDLPLYFLRKKKPISAFKALFWEISNYFTIYFLYTINTRATIFTLIIPLVVMRLGLMIGNWGQHAFVDDINPNSDYRSSITLIDVSSNRFGFNDGYHTSHHLNPRRHWRDHPVSFMEGKKKYSDEKALVFTNIDYLMITFTLLRKDYNKLAKCLVPIGEEQMKMSLEEIEAMLESKTAAFNEDKIEEKFKS
ncbi:hypothetical protein M231_06949 [Tremella mesenterica]|uniref:Fatty acid desaturase domain-containing protein n=1 Tax=Tremella mesenterica TaxID=5217 RepID=A0A4Q1BG26_TREME|nr:hypothetical protein M231_06949 [Tremella mesenterica]